MNEEGTKEDLLTHAVMCHKAKQNPERSGEDESSHGFLAWPIVVRSPTHGRCHEARDHDG